MSLTNTVVKATYTGDGANTTFAIPFTNIVDDSSETKVYLRDETDPDAIVQTLLTEGSGNDYVLTGAPTANDFHTDVEMAVAPTATQKLVIHRQLPLTQLLSSGSGYPRPESLEEAYDRLVAMIQQQQEILGRVPKIRISSQITELNMALPVDIPDEGIIGFNADATAVRFWTPEEIFLAGTAVAGVTTLDELQVDNINLDANTISTTNTNGNLNLSPNGTGKVVVAGELNVSNLSNGSRALVSTATGELSESAVTTTELGYVSGATSNIQAQIDLKLGLSGSSTDNAVARYDGVGGQIQNSAVIIDDAAALSGITSLDVDNININGNTIITTNTNGDLTLTPNGTGGVVVSSDLGVGNINIDTNTIITTNTNGNLNITPDGTGIVAVNSDMTVENLGLGGAPNANSILDVTSTAKASRPFPSMTAAQRDGIASPQNGMFVYNTDSGKLNQYTAGAWNEVSGGGGSGGINYVINPDFEVNTNDVTVSANITKAEEAANPIRGSKSLRLTIAAAATTSNYADIELDTFSLADTDGSRNIIISFEYYTDANFSTDDVQFVLRNNTDSEDIIPQDILNGQIQGSTTTAKYVGHVATKSGVTNYSLRMKVLSAPGTASNIRIDNVRVGPDSLAPGYIGTKPEAYTPTFGAGFGTVSAVTFRQHRDGSFLSVKGKFTAGTVAASIAELSLPSGLTTGNTNAIVIGRWWRVANSTATTRKTGNIWIGSGSLVRFGSDDYTSAAAPYSALNVTEMCSTSDVIEVDFKVQIQDWEASTLISSTEAFFKNARTLANFKTTTGTLTSSYHNTIFGTVDFDPMGLYNTTTGVWTAPINGVIDVSAYIEVNHDATSNVTNVRIFNITKGATLNGVRGVFKDTSAASVKSLPQAHGSLEVSAGDQVAVQVLTLATTPTYGNTFTAGGFSISYRPDISTYGAYIEPEIYTAVKTGVSEGTVSNDTWYTVSSLSLSLPAGRYDLSYGVNIWHEASTSAIRYGNVGIFTSGGTLVGNSISLYGLTFGTDGINLNMARTVLGVVLSAPTTLQVRIRKSVGDRISVIENISGALTDPDGSSIFQAKRY